MVAAPAPDAEEVTRPAPDRRPRLATTLAGRIVGESLDDDERARRTVERFIASLPPTSG